jgi:hypothetical protein
MKAIVEFPRSNTASTLLVQYKIVVYKYAKASENASIH